MNYITATWQLLTAPFKWIAAQWTKFNNWVASKFPGWKTKFTLALGALGTAAAAFQEYFTGMPTAEVLKMVGLTGEQASLLNVFMYTLAFWFRGLSK